MPDANSQICTSPVTFVYETTDKALRHKVNILVTRPFTNEKSKFNATIKVISQLVERKLKDGPSCFRCCKSVGGIEANFPTSAFAFTQLHLEP